MRVRESPTKACACPVELSIALSIPELQLLLRERVKESVGQRKAGSLKSAEPLLPDRVDCLKPCDGSFFAPRGNDHGLALLGLLQELGQVRLGFENCSFDHEPTLPANLA